MAVEPGSLWDPAGWHQEEQEQEEEEEAERREEDEEEKKKEDEEEDERREGGLAQTGSDWAAGSGGESPDSGIDSPSSAEESGPSPCGPARSKRLSPSAKGASESSPNKMKILRSIVDKAAQGHKTFTIFGKYPSIRDALKTRGWIQNFDVQRLTLPRQRQFDDEVSVAARLQGGDDVHVISRLLRNTPVSFVWVMGDNIDWKSLSKSTIVSRFPRVYFTTKVGLCSYLQQSHWFCETGVSNPRFPRCYNISTAEDLNTFIRDFRITACLGLLKHLVMLIENASLQYFSDDGKIPLSAVEFAAKRCTEYVASQEHEDIDRDTEEKVWDHQWDQFLTHYYHLVQENSAFTNATDVQIKVMYSCSKLALEAIKPYWPQLDMDGVNNLWIVKPGAKSRGRGINVLKNLEDIVSKIGPLHPNDPRFVIQKYIEKPLLIYNCKFDIRQWFLVTSAYPLTIWMYKESYLRFCSQLFSLSNMHESVHLSNNAVQCKYKNAKRHQALPEENMWDCYTFQTYLRTLGLADRWETVIYPGMRECITGSLLAAQEHMEHRRNCFELYGADFILTEDLVPWLIEINSSPCMSPTTSVTARMCSQCLEDVVKVVIDKRYNKDADTGMFEMVYKQQISNPQPYMGMNLTVKGNRIGKNPKSKGKSCFYAEADPRESKSPSMREALSRLSSELMTEEEAAEAARAKASVGSAGSKPKPPPTASSTASSSSELKEEEPRPKVKKRSYKKHSCLNHNQFNRFNRINTLTRRVRLHSNNLRKLNIPQPADIYDWRARLQQNRTNCQEMLSKLKVLKEPPPTAPEERSAPEEPPIKEEEKLPKVVEEDPETPARTSSPRKEKSALLLPEIKIGLLNKDVNNNTQHSLFKSSYYRYQEHKVAQLDLEKFSFTHKITNLHTQKLIKSTKEFLKSSALSE